MNIQITSPAFNEGGMIPRPYTCDGADISPPLALESVPDKTRSIVLICDDPDAPAGTWVHWVLYDWPAGERSIPESVLPQKELKNGAKQGTNDFRNIGYGGPCPPGGTHRYYFKAYAVDMLLGLKPGASKAQVLEAMKGHILAEGQLMGRYKK